jgi:F0F1-type ATP synthase assembly protein I
MNNGEAIKLVLTDVVLGIVAYKSMGWTGPALVLGTYIVGTIINYFWPSHHA